MIVVGSLHGNEPSGVQAMERVVASLDERRTALRGDLLLVSGNLSAIAHRVRFVDKDLNRQWTPARVAALTDHRASGGSPEDREQQELLELIEGALATSRGAVHFVDLHTSSAPGAPFLTIGDTLRNRRFIREMPVPVILGLEEQVDGSLLEYLNNHGFVTVGVEAGQHDDPCSTDRHEAVLWLCLLAAGILGADDVPRLDERRALLARASAGVAPVIEVRSRHNIRPGAGFEMLPGFVNFQRIRRGQPLARDRGGEILAPEDGLILLPLYQGQGNDGFFVAREVRPAWLAVSAVLRRLGLGALMPLLPGVRRDPSRSDALIVDTRIARYYPLEIFHLFGFRKLRREGDELVVSRRRYDREPPREITLEREPV
jgi:succinylglutamate desuccinylase